MQAKHVAGSELTHLGRQWVAPVSFRTVGAAVFTLDMIIIAVFGVTCSILYQLSAYGRVFDLSRYVGVALVVCTIYGGAAQLQNLYEPIRIAKDRRDSNQVVAIWASVWIFLTCVAFVLKIGDLFSRGAVLSFAISGGSALVLTRLAWRRALRSALVSGRFKAKRVALITFGETELRSVVRNMFRHGVHPVRRLTLSVDVAAAGWSERLQEFCNDMRGSDLEEVYVSSTLAAAPAVLLALDALRTVPLPVRLVAEGDFANLLARPAHRMDSVVSVELQRAPLGVIEQATKRGLDIAVSSVALVVLSPVFLLIGAAIKIESAGPALFKQHRQGFNGRIFRILKFRSMFVQEDGELVPQAKRNDSRVTNVGRFIRRTSLDELPQLLNVLLGHMSLVGPRPHAVAHDNYYDNVIADYALRRHVKPGLTGWAQVQGCRGETPTIESMAARLSYDRWYIDNWSLWLDVKILFMTLREIRGHHNVY